jgi:hypothetical protein
MSFDSHVNEVSMHELCIMLLTQINQDFYRNKSVDSSNIFGERSMKGRKDSWKEKKHV